MSQEVLSSQDLGQGSAVPLKTMICVHRAVHPLSLMKFIRSMHISYKLTALFGAFLVVCVCKLSMVLVRWPVK